MILLQRLNGIRSGGLVAMTPRQFERVGDLLLYTEPEEVAAKTGRERHWLGPLAQAELKPFLDAAAAVGPDELLFRPAIRPRRAVAGYTVIYFGQYIARLCAKLGVEHWHPHQLRHEHLTKVRRLYGPGRCAGAGEPREPEYDRNLRRGRRRPGPPGRPAKSADGFLAIARKRPDGP
jgi:integrase